MPAILGRLNDPDVWIRAAAVEALGNLGSSAVIEPLVKAYWDETKYYRGAHRVAVAVLKNIVSSDSDLDKDRALAAIKELRGYDIHNSHRAAYELVINRRESQSELYDLADCADSGYLDDYLRSLLRYLFPNSDFLRLTRVNGLLAGRLVDEDGGSIGLDLVRPAFETSLRTLLAALDLETYYAQTVSQTISRKCAKCENKSGSYRCTRCNREFCEACLRGFGDEAAQILTEYILGKNGLTFGTANIFDEQGRAFCPHCYGILLLKSRLTGDWTVQNDEQRNPTCISNQK